MKFSILVALTLWVTVAAAQAAATPTPSPTPTPTPAPILTVEPTPERPLAYPDIRFPIADLETWLKALQDSDIEQHPGVVTMYIKTSDDSGNLYIIVSGKEHIRSVREQAEVAGVPYKSAWVRVDNPWDRQYYTCTPTPQSAIC